MENYLWVEKWRPKEFKDVIGVPEEIINVVNNNNLMHLLLTGKAGTGKTTTAKIIINKLASKDTLILNASNERGIDVIRDKVKTFAMTTSSNQNIKIVFLDEADYLTKDAQASLRNLMEEYSRTCKFILTGNYDNKIIDALKSRCSWFKFQLPEKESIFERLKFISKKESLNIEEDALREIVTKYYPDIRKSINVLQEFSFLNKKITKEMVTIEKTFAIELFNKIKNGNNWNKIRTWILDSNLDFVNSIEEIVNWVKENKPKNSIKILFVLLEMNRYINICGNPELEFSLGILKIMNLMKEDVK